jgi:hypothetical protein
MKQTLKLTMLLLLFGVLSAKAQDVEGTKPPSDKKKIELRPNSRDYGAVRRDNLNQRIDRKHDKNLFQKKRPAGNRKFVKPGVKKEFKRDQRIQRRQRTIQQRKLINR